MKPVTSLITTTILVLAAAPSRAEDPIYLGQKQHARVDVGLGIQRTGVEALSLSPVLSGRVPLSDAYGVSATVPLAYTSFSGTGGAASTSNFTVGNPWLAFELVDEAEDYRAAGLSFGLAIPTLHLPDDLDGIVQTSLNTSLAASSRGLVDLWLWSPDSLGLVAQFHTASFFPGQVYVDLRFSLGVLLPTADNDFELGFQSVLRFGYEAGPLVPFVGLTVAFWPTFDDMFQGGIELGTLINLGGPSIDLALQTNLDDPGGFSFDDGVIGLHLGVTVPF